MILKVIFANSVDPDQTARSSLIRGHTVCVYAKICMKNLQEYRHKQTTFSDAGFLDILRVYGHIHVIKHTRRASIL